jgi:hypothetical protein
MNIPSPKSLREVSLTVAHSDEDEQVEYFAQEILAKVGAFLLSAAKRGCTAIDLTKDPAINDLYHSARGLRGKVLVKVINELRNRGYVYDPTNPTWISWEVEVT